MSPDRFFALIASDRTLVAQNYTKLICVRRQKFSQCRSDIKNTELSSLSYNLLHTVQSSCKNSFVFRWGTDLISLLILLLWFLLRQPLQKAQRSGISNRVVMIFGGTVFHVKYASIDRVEFSL